MRALALGMLLVFASTALGQDIPTDRPLMLHILDGTGTLPTSDGKTVTKELPSGWFITDLGYDKLNEIVQHASTDNVRLKAENAEQAKQIDSLTADPPASSTLVWVVVGTIAGALAAGFIVHKLDSK